MAKRQVLQPVMDLPALRREITGLVARNALAMVQHAIDAVHEDGQYQAIRFLFEMVGLYPAAAQEESLQEDSLAKLLLQALRLPSELTNDQNNE